MITHLIVNADDFGISLGQNLAIIDGFQRGIITSTTLMINMPWANHAIKLAKENPDLPVGIHLCATQGPVTLDTTTDYKDEKGWFKLKSTYKDELVVGDEEQMYLEWKAQIEKFIQLMGQKPTHIDSHHHVHNQANYQAITKRLSEEYDLPVRQKTQYLDNYPFVKVTGGFYNPNPTIELLEEVLTLEEGMIEVMCHPALLDQDLLDMTSYGLPRAKEHQVLVSQKIKDFIQENNISLISFKNVKEMH